jgi:hypothetical protein
VELRGSPGPNHPRQAIPQLDPKERDVTIQQMIDDFNAAREVGEYVEHRVSGATIT